MLNSLMSCSSVTLQFVCAFALWGNSLTHLCVDAHVTSELQVVGKKYLTDAAKQDAFWPESVALLCPRIRLKYFSTNIHHVQVLTVC